MKFGGLGVTWFEDRLDTDRNGFGMLGTIIIF